MGQELTVSMPGAPPKTPEQGERSTDAGEGLAPFAFYDRSVNYCVSTTT